ncbi:MAG: hypothetical protein IT453_17965 [Planctomycetes bacterium]|nr:hypothetical protein [Planctomycetota bacterium]
MRSYIIKGVAAFALIASSSMLSGCSGGEAKVNATLLKTDCIEVVTVDGHVSLGTVLNVSAGAVRYTIKENCNCVISSLSYKVFQDRNNNGVEDPGEQMFGSSGQNLGGHTGTIGGGTASVMAAQGMIRWEAKATVKCGDKETPLQQYGSF